MTHEANRHRYRPGQAAGARIQEDGGRWALVLTRELRHSPSLVWQALTDPSHLMQWAPFDADRNLAALGPVQLATVGPTPHVSESNVTRVEHEKRLEYEWGGNVLRWQLEGIESGTRLTLWHNIDRRFIAWGAAGWHICLDVLAALLGGAPLGRIVGGDAMSFEWERLNGEYAEQFGIESPNFPTG